MFGQCVVHSASLVGVTAIPVRVEVSIGPGIPGFSIVGMPDIAVRESQERVKAAIRSAGFSMPTDKIVVNLAPGSLRKTGTGFDLPIAVALLVITKQIDAQYAQHILWVAELSLDGFVRGVRGMLSYEVCARNQGLDFVVSPDAAGVSLLDGLTLYSLKHLSGLRHENLSLFKKSYESYSVEYEDYGAIIGHDIAKRAMQIAAVGNHGILLMGPPGSGKTILSKALPSILPSLSEDEILQSALIYSVAEQSHDAIMSGIRPFRNPHHSSSLAGLVGGGNPIRPGEISLAHNGVLFLDEIAEFSPRALQALRQPMEHGYISLVRADFTIELPSRFMLVAASNPCPCGYYGDPEHHCSCSSARIESYQNRIGGPLLDRIDMHLDVWRTNPKDMISQEYSPCNSQRMKSEVEQALSFRETRRSSETPQKQGLGQVVEECHFSSKTMQLFEAMAQRCLLSGRGMKKVLSLARSIADLEQVYEVSENHVLEAFSFRLRKGQ